MKIFESGFERRIVILISLSVILLASAPLLIGYHTTPSDMEFAWMTMCYNSADDISYFAWIKQAVDGKFLFRNAYAVEKHNSIFFQPLFLGVGMLSSVSGLDYRIVYHICKLVSGFILLIVAYYFISMFIKERRVRLIAFLLVCFSSGLGVFMPDLGGLGPIDLWMPEAITFYSIEKNLIFPFSTFLILLAFIWYIKAFDTRKKKYAVLTGVVTLLLGFTHQYDLVTVYGVMICYFLYRCWTENKMSSVSNLAIIIAISSTAVIYSFYVIHSEPLFSTWLMQSSTLSASPALYLAGYGLLFVFGIYGISEVIKNKRMEYAFPVIWLTLLPILLYLPINFQRRLSMGAYIPLCILAAVGIFALFKYYKGLKFSSEKAKRLLFFSLILLIAFLVTATNLSRTMTLLNLNSENCGCCYIEKEFIRGLECLDMQTKPGTNILSSDYIGYLIPLYTKDRPFVGHYDQTPRIKEKIALLENSLHPYNESALASLLDTYEIGYFIVEDRHTSGIDWGGKGFLEGVCTNKKLTVYKVIL